VHVYVKTLGKIASRYAPTRLLSFHSVHVFIILQLTEKKGMYVETHCVRNYFLEKVLSGH